MGSGHRPHRPAAPGADISTLPPTVTEVPDSPRDSYVHVDFADWTRGRTPLTLGTNTGATPLAFQNWRRFKEAFAPELVARAVHETSKALGRQVTTCIDPFAGSGTTPLACQFLGVTPTAIEVNPYLADLTEAKLTPVDGQCLARKLAEVFTTSCTVDPISYYSTAPRTFVEPGIRGRFLFFRDIAARLASLVHAISEIREPAIRRILRVLLGAAALEVCNATVSGKGRRYRRNWQNRHVTPKDLDHHFAIAVHRAVYDVTRFAGRATLKFDLIRGDARQELATLTNADLAVFSPPYLNSFDYTDVYNIELWGLGYLRSSEQNTVLRLSTLRSHVQIKRDLSANALPPLATQTIGRLRSAPALWNRWIPDMVGAYFADLRAVLQQLRRMLPRHGRVYVVVAASQYSGIAVPVSAALSELAPALGYQVVSIDPLGTKRASPQQGGRNELPESLVILSAA